MESVAQERTKNGIYIKINTIEKMKEFNEIAKSFTHSDIMIRTDYHIIDAKSILGIMSLDLSNPLYVEILTNDENERKYFNLRIEKFREVNTNEI